ncbi:MAG: hypothetical protein ACTTHM_02940 [Peptoanaerobacter stomatis]
MSEELCICNNVPALLRQIFSKSSFSKNTFYRFFNPVKTNCLHFTSLLAVVIVNNNLKKLTDDKIKMFSSLMTAFLIVPAARKQNCGQRFLTTPICISKKFLGYLA